jgi:uncharacterized repeat protein (TIGR03803 family)
VRKPRITIALLVFTACAAAQAQPTLTTLYNFTGGSDGFNPTAGVVIGSGGVLYGTTYSYGSFTNEGTAFSLTPPAAAGGAWTHTTIQEFTGNNGVYVHGGLVIGSGGVLYGTCHNGGADNDYGTAFSLTPPSSPGGAWTGDVIWEFATGYGNQPLAGMVIGKGGVLLGTTSVDSTVYELIPPASSGGAWTYHNVHIFTGYPSDGNIPDGGVVIGKDGVLYGTTQRGGNSYCSGLSPGCGVVFSLTPPATPGGAWTEAVLHNFNNDGTDGFYPEAGVVVGLKGALYGTTFDGGTDNYGTVFSLTPPASPGGAWTYAILYSFVGGSDGAHPLASLTVGRHGVLYGITNTGGPTNNGTVFSLTPPTSPGGPWSEAVLHSFSGSDGSEPTAPVVIGSGGVLYGTTELGGSHICGGLGNGCGTVFSLTP